RSPASEMPENGITLPGTSSCGAAINESSDFSSQTMLADLIALLYRKRAAEPDLRPTRPPSPGPPPLSSFVAWQTAQLAKIFAPCAASCPRARSTAPTSPTTINTGRILSAFMPTFSSIAFLRGYPCSLAARRRLEAAWPLCVADQVVAQPE